MTDVVVIELKADEAGTLLRLTHSALAPPPIAEHHREGWERYLERLRVRAEGGDPRPDREELVERDAVPGEVRSLPALEPRVEHRGGRGR